MTRNQEVAEGAVIQKTDPRACIFRVIYAPRNTMPVPEDHQRNIDEAEAKRIRKRARG